MLVLDLLQVQAEEFFSSLLDIASAEFIGSSQCENLLREYDLAAKGNNVR